MLALTFQVGHDRLALDVRQVREVIPRVQLRPVMGGPAWLAGLVVYRGRVVPVIDLHHLVGAKPCPPHLSSRIILVLHPGERGEQVLGIQAASVSDVQEVNTPEEAPIRYTQQGRPDLGPVVVDGSGLLHLLDLGSLLPEQAREQLALVPLERVP